MGDPCKSLPQQVNTFSRYKCHIYLAFLHFCLFTSSLPYFHPPPASHLTNTNGGKKLSHLHSIRSPPLPSLKILNVYPPLPNLPVPLLSPGIHLQTIHHKTHILAWWYTCKKVTWLFFLRRMKKNCGTKKKSSIRSHHVLFHRVLSFQEMQYNKSKTHRV